MAKIKNAFIWQYSVDSWNDAFKRAKKRIETEYKRDIRLDENERIEKIAIGYLGEFAFKEWCTLNSLEVVYLGEEVGFKPDNGDFISVSNVVIDVKTQEVAYMPQDDWRCEVTSEQINRPSDIYVFSKLFSKENRLYVVGWITKNNFKEKAQYREPGTLLKGKPVHYPKYDVTIDELNELGTLKMGIADIHKEKK